MLEIHASALGSILDCARRAVAHESTPEPADAVQSIATVVGRMAHAVYRAAAVSDEVTVHERAARGAWPATPLRYDAHTRLPSQAVSQSVRIGQFAHLLTCAVFPESVAVQTEEPIVGVIRGQRVVGTVDRIHRTSPDPSHGRRIVDLKTGANLRPMAYAVQLGAYLELLDAATDPVIVGVSRRDALSSDLRMTPEYAASVAGQHVTVLNGAECRRMARRAAATWRSVGESAVVPWANPGSFLCTAKTCRIHGTADCPLIRE